MSVLKNPMLRYRAFTIAQPQVMFLHMYCGLSIEQIANNANISRKTVDRILAGQKPTIKQWNKLAALIRKAATEFHEARKYHNPAKPFQNTHSHILFSLEELANQLGKIRQKDK